MKNITLVSRVRTWLNQIPIQDPIDRRMASMLELILLGLIAIIILAGLVNAAIMPSVPWSVMLLRSLIFILVIFFPLAMLRRGYFHGSLLIIISMLLLLETFAVTTASLRSIAETLSFFTLAIILAGLMLGRQALIITFFLSVAALFVSIVREPAAQLRLDGIVITTNFMLLNGLISMFVDRFGVTLRASLSAALERENELQEENYIRRQAELALQQFTARLEILHEIDRSLLSARTHHEISKTALARIRKLIPCLRASVSLLDVEKKEANFLAVDFDGPDVTPHIPISFAEFGQQTIDDLLQNEPSIICDSLEGSIVTPLDIKLAKFGIRSWACLPLHSQGQLVGSLNLGRPAGEFFTAEEVEIARDVADQLAIALQQTNLYNALQVELVERKKLISQLESNNAELERFTYTVSHDLRSPLVTMKGFLGMLRKDLQDGRQDRLQSDFRRIENAADKMQALLTDLLELSRIGRIMNPPEEVKLVQVIKEAIETLDARLSSSQVTINYSLDLPSVYADRVRMREVFENLIDNAAKYRGDQADPIIEIGVREHHNENVIYVKDNGLGIDTPYQSKIFGLFDKLNPSSEGTGIGLAIIKRIIETHGGRIWVESEGLGKGSTFCFTIPDSRKGVTDAV